MNAELTLWIKTTVNKNRISSFPLVVFVGKFDYLIKYP